MNNFDQIKFLHNEINTLLLSIKEIKPSLYEEYLDIVDNSINDFINLGIDYIEKNPQEFEIFLKKLNNIIKILKFIKNKENINEIKLVSLLSQILEEDRCKRIADRKYDKPSAYKSGAIVRCRKGNIWKDLKEDENQIQSILDKAKTYKIPYSKINQELKKDWIPTWKIEYDNNLAKINELVARHLLYRIAEDLVGGVNEIEFKNESKSPTKHFQMVMYLESIILYTSPFIYVDNNHKIVADQTKIELLNEDYDTLYVLKEDIEQIDISTDVFIKRIPFLKQFNNLSDNKHIFLQKVDYNENKKIMWGDDLINFKQVNTSIEFKYYKNKIHDNYFFHFILDFRLHLMPPENLSDLERRVLIMANNLNNKKYSYNKEIRSKNNNLSEEEFDEIINELNGKFFQIEEYINSSIFNIKNPLTEVKKETLHKWFARKGAPGKTGGWVDCNTCRDGKCKACGRKKDEKRAKYPSCRPTPSQCKSPGKGKKWGKTK